MQSNNLFPDKFPPLWASEWGEDDQGLWAVFCYKKVYQVFRWISPGQFMMGSPDDEKGRVDWENLHPVEISQGFWFADTTVTQALWQVVMGDNPSSFSDNANNPVESVSWDDTKKFLDNINRSHPELKARLPYEAEWEYACRAGTQDAFSFSGDLTLDKVNYRGIWEWTSTEDWADEAKQATVAVKSMNNPNRWGLHEMHGNVWEWCEDYWQENWGKELVKNPKGAKAGSRRVVRGGSWYYDGGRVRSALRSLNSPDVRDGSIGFRLALGQLSSG